MVKPLPRSKIILFLPLLVVLAACEPKRIELVKPPVALTACADEPVAPDLPAVDWTSVETARPIQANRDDLTLDYILALRSAGGDCSADVAGIKAWSDGLE
jgi:hypothetical protein